jgi:hypothetical protein
MDYSMYCAEILLRSLYPRHLLKISKNSRVIMNKSNTTGARVGTLTRVTQQVSELGL